MEERVLYEMGRSLAESPTWSVATVITALVAFGFLVQRSLKRFGMWLVKTKRKALLAALMKIKEELMLFGLLSLMLGHWTGSIAKICVRSSAFSSRFYPCAKDVYEGDMRKGKHLLADGFYHWNYTHSRVQQMSQQRGFCHKGHEPFASYESLEQLHRLLIVLAIVHVSYSFSTVALAMIKIQGWRGWESEAREMAIPSEQGSLGIDLKKVVIRRQTTFISHHTSHPWSQNRVLIWMLCFIRQFWSSINRADYLALRLGFITNHNLHLSYDFHGYMLRSMEEEFRDIVGISIPLWVYAIICILLNFHGTNLYFWLSFIPAILTLLVGTKLHHIVSQLAIEAMNARQITGNQLKPRDELFWFQKPKLLLRVIQLISFQNAYEMATFLWSLWEIKEPSCFMKNHLFLAIRLSLGIIFQLWCSYNTFPLYVIVTQMGSKFKKALIAENIRGSLHGWVNRVKDKCKPDCHRLSLTTTTSATSLQSMADEKEEIETPSVTISGPEQKRPSFERATFVISSEVYEQHESDDALEGSCCSIPINGRPGDDSGSGGSSGRNEGDEDECDDQVKERVMTSSALINSVT